MMTKRSSHMPMLTKIDMMKSSVVLWRTLFSHRNCTITTLIEINVQYDQP